MESLDPRYSIDWAHHAANVTSNLRRALDQKLLTDIVLDCQGRILHLHKLILVGSSGFFAARSCEHFVRIGDVRPDLMDCLVEFMYFGKVFVPAKDMDEFFSAGERLGIRGLTTKAEVAEVANGGERKDDMKDLRNGGNHSHDGNDVQLLGEVKDERVDEIEVDGKPCVAEEGSRIPWESEDGGLEFDCSVCKRFLAPKPDLFEYMQSVHGVQPWHTKSDKGKKKKSPKARPNEEETSLEVHKCDICDKVCHSRQGVALHVVKMHAGSFACSVCGEVYGSKGVLDQHTKVHHKQSFECNRCRKKFPTRQLLDSHSLTHQTENEDVVEVIEGKGKGKKQNVLAKSKKSFGCKICPEKFTGKKALKLHSNTHQKLHKCFFCEISFNSKHLLNNHNNRIHLEAYKCDLCGKLVSCSSALTAHKLVHSVEEPFECSICGQRFRMAMLLQRHYSSCEKKQPRDS